MVKQVFNTIFLYEINGILFIFMIMALINTLTTKITGFDANQWGIFIANKTIDSLPYLTDKTYNVIIITSPYFGYAFYTTLGLTTSLKVAELFYNYNYFLNKTIEKTPVVSQVSWGINKVRNVFSKKTVIEPTQIEYYPLFNNVMTSIGINKLFKERVIIREIEKKKEIMKETTIKLPEYIAALPQEKIEAIDTLTQNFQKYTNTLEKATKLVNIELSEKSKLVRLDFLAPFMQKEYYGSKVRRFPNSVTPYRLVSEMGPDKINDFVIEQIILEMDTHEIAAYPDKPNTESFFKVIGRLKVDIEAEMYAKQINLKRMRKTPHDPGFCYFDIAIDDNLKNNPDCACFMEFLKQNPELASNKIELHRDAAGNLYTVTMSSYTNGHASAVIDTFTEIQKCATEMQEYSNELTLSYSSVALAAATVVLPWQEIFQNLTHMNEIVNAIQNPEAARAIISSLQQVGQIIPDFLQPFAANPVIPTTQELNPSDIAEIKPNIPTTIAPSSFGLNWTTGLGMLVAAGAIGGTIYCIKNGIPNPFAAKEVVESAASTDFSKYLNLK